MVRMSANKEAETMLVGDTGDNATSKMLTSQHYEPTEEDKAYKGWRHLIPFKRASKNPKTLPLIAAGPLNYSTAHWANGLIYKAYKTDLTEDDLYDTPWKDSAGRNSNRFEKLWNEELAKHGKEKASVARTIIKMIRVRLICAVILTFLFSGFAILGPALATRGLLEETASADKSVFVCLFWSIGLAIIGVGRLVTIGDAFAFTENAGVRVRGGVLSLVFKKILYQQMQHKSVGELVNLCANDGQRLFDASMMGVFALGSLASVAGAAYAINLLGPWGILGFVVFLMFLPIQILLSKVVFNFRRKAIPVTEERVKLMSEIVTAIKLVKMYAWEKSFAKKINDIRIREKNIIASSLMVQSISSGLPQLVPLFASAFTFLAMTSTGVDLTVTQAFVFISLLNSLRFTLGIMPYSMKSLAEGRHACDRIKAVLIAEDEKMEVACIKDTNNIVEIRNGYFGWQAQPEAQPEAESGKKPGKPAVNGTTKNGSAKANGTKKVTKSSDVELEPLAADEGERKLKTIITLHDITMSLNQGTLLGVCGAVGSGKTSLMQAVLGMMKKRGGEIAINQAKKIAYVPQQAWIMNTTVRENIIFGHEFEQQRYDQVVEACALLSDFDQLAAGDQTEIGERGINLSGGQKQRISIARAVYSDSDLILLDDPLSAVDAHVGQHIFLNCLKGFLRNKTILFTTHQLQFLTGCDYILVMKDGRITEEGTHEVLMGHDNGEYANLIKSFHDAEEKEQAREVDNQSLTGSFYSRQQSKISAFSRQYSVKSDPSVQSGEDKSVVHGSQGRLRISSIASQTRGVVVNPDATANVSHSTNNLHLTVGADPDDDFRHRTVSMSSMKSARSHALKALAEARSNNRLDNSMAEAMVFGSVKDLLTPVVDDAEEIIPVINDNEKEAPRPSGKLTKSEEMEQGAVKLSTFTSYMSAAGGACIVLAVFALVILAVATQAFSNYWLSLWIKAGSAGAMRNETVWVNGTEIVTLVLSDSILHNPRIDFYQMVYGCSLLVIVLIIVVKSQSYMRVSLRASSKLHDKIFRKLVASPMRFFDVTPSGQILNRFSKDMDEMDAMLPFISEQFLNNAFVMIVTVVIIATVFPYFLLAMIPIVIVFLVLYKICQKGIRSIKRIDNVTRSPLFSHIATTVQGLGTIRAYKKEEQFHIQFNKLQDRNNMALFLFHSAMRWTAVRLDALSLLVVFATALFVTFVPNDVISPSLAALALAYAMNMTGLFQYTMRLAIETEARFTSVERIQNYIKDLESEAPPIMEGQRPDDSWPKEGAIKFDNVDVRYREGLPLVLKSISMDIKAQEKIGIVGRTGSGKSSLGMVIFRMMELAGGSISIDDIDISTIGLEDLRSKLSIIPQDPVLFVGTVRYNLDPFHTYTDDELWSALTKCHVKPTIQALDGQLDATIVENGENFSVGERQLLCMARALLRHSKILLLDEATAAIDTETDSLIQDTIKEAFADCTMLTIAHRLNTVASSDRILVLDDGKVIEFDTPAKLLANSESVFAQMMAVQESQKHAAMETGQQK